MRISGSFLTMLIIWLLGFTHFFGGPFLLFRIIFWVALLPFFIAVFFILLIFMKTKRLFRDTKKSQNSETIHVDAEVKE